MDNIRYNTALSTGTTHVFDCTADGDRTIMHVVVEDVVGTEELVIKIMPIGFGTDQAEDTLGRTHVRVTLDENGTQRHVCSNCIVSYIVPRTATMLARLYVPHLV